MGGRITDAASDSLFGRAIARHAAPRQSRVHFNIRSYNTHELFLLQGFFLVRRRFMVDFQAIARSIAGRLSLITFRIIPAF